MRHESAPNQDLLMMIIIKIICLIRIEKRLKWMRKIFVTTEEEPFFDAADVLRFGKDLLTRIYYKFKGIIGLRDIIKSQVHAQFPGDLLPYRCNIHI